jgi:hypothetical protein
MLRRSRFLLIGFLFLLALEGLAVLARLASIPADPKNSLLLGYSLSRLVMMAAALGLSLLTGLAGAALWRSPSRYARAAAWLDGRGAARLVGGLLALLAAGSWLALVLLRADLERNLSAYQRLQPVLLLAFLAGLQGLLLLPLWRFGLRGVEGMAAVRRASLATFAAFGLLFALVALTGFGVTPDLYAWGAPGVPLLAWQVALAVLLGCWVYLLFPGSRAGAPDAPRYLNLLVCVAVWALAVGLWLSQPLQPSYFNPQVRPPNAEYYPYSDAGYYDYIAEGLISGGGYMGGRGVTRPLYIFFLALLHLVGGHGYSTMIVLQTLALALFPVALYRLGSVFHSRAAGLLVALLAILRELNAYAATPLTEVSHAKMLLSDLPATLGMVLLVLACVRWLQHPERRWMPVVAGGTAGLLALLRAQSLLVMPFIFMLALFVYRGKFLRLVEAGVLVAVGAALALTPWMGRNAIAGNGFAIDQPGNQVIIFAQRYSFEIQRWPPREAGESEAEYSRRMLGLAREFALQHPGYTAGFIGAHFLNNIIDTAVVLPVRAGFDDYRDNWTISTFFWEKLFTPLGAGGAALLLLNLALISLGVGASWARWRALGLLPLIIVPAYSLSNAIARNSGWRYILPVDWVGYFYFAIGVLTVFAWLLAALGRVPAVDSPYRPAPFSPGAFPWWRAAGMGLLFLLVGSSVPLAERVFPALYPAMPPAQMAEQILDSPAVQSSGADLDALHGFLASDSALLMRGRALYPRFYYSGQGELGNGWPAYAIREGSRMAFMLLQAGGVRQVLLRQPQPPRVFPHAGDVLVAGCEDREGVLQAVLAVVPGDPSYVYFRDLDEPFACPLP